MLKNTFEQNLPTSFKNFKEKLKIKFDEIFLKHKKNKLISSIIYSYNNFINDVDLLFFYNVFINFKNNCKESILLCLIISSILIYLSFLISYNFEHMLNKNISNGKPCLHIIYGETISQLSAFCLYIESQNLILNNENINSKEKSILINLNIDVIKKYDKQLQNDIELINDENKKKLLSNDFQNKFKNIILVLLKCVYFFKNKNVNYDNTDILNEISNTIIQNLQLKKQLKENKINQYNYNNELIKNKMNLNTFIDKYPKYTSLRNLC